MEPFLAAVQQGVGFAKQIAEDNRREVARKAATQQFGAAANDPGLFTALQQLQNAQGQEQRAQAGEQRAQAGEQRRQQTFDRGIQAEDQTRKLTAARGIIQGLRIARDNGEDLGAAFDASRDALLAAGVSDADIPDLRAQLVDNPGVLDSALEALGGGAGGARQPATPARGPAGGQPAQTNAPPSQAAESVTRLANEGIAIVERLNKAGSIRSDNPSGTIDRVSRGLATTGVGTFASDLLSTNSATARQELESVRVGLLQQLTQVEGMSARMFDTEAEKQLWLSMIGSPRITAEAQVKLLRRFNDSFGAGGIRLTRSELNDLAGDKDAVAATAQDVNANLSAAGIAPNTAPVDGAPAGTPAQPGASAPPAAQTPVTVYPGFVNPATGATFTAEFSNDVFDERNWELP